jgi:MATE family multidrug resistance protein
MGTERELSAGQPADLHPPGSVRELLALAWPLILSSSFWTLQIVLDRVLLGQSGSQALAAAMASAVMFWTMLTLFQYTANYATTFVAQYTGAGRPGQVGPVVWQALHFSLAAGAGFVALAPFAGALVALGGHPPELQALETSYLRCLCLSAPPTLVTAAVSSFFAGRGDSRTVLLINSVGLAVNGLSAYLLIFGHWGLPAWGIAGAGTATILGSTSSMLLSLALFLRRRHRAECRTAAGWRFDRDLFRRLLRYGFPNGLFTMLDALAFTVFLQVLGRLGEVELAASSVAFTLNLVCILPILGIGQAVEVLVGQRLGADRPAAAEKATWTGMRMALAFTGAVAVAYVFIPGVLAEPFRSEADPAAWAAISLRVPVLLRFVSLYALFDSANVILSFALRGAGDTRFVTRVALALPWPLMVLPTLAALHYGWGLYWAWTFASVYIVSLALTFLVRFRQGKWRDMRIIGPDPTG